MRTGRSPHRLVAQPELAGGGIVVALARFARSIIEHAGIPSASFARYDARWPRSVIAVGSGPAWRDLQVCLLGLL